MKQTLLVLVQGISCAESRSYGVTGTDPGSPGFAQAGVFEKHGSNVHGLGLLFGFA